MYTYLYPQLSSYLQGLSKHSLDGGFNYRIVSPKNWGTCSILHFRRAETTNYFMFFELSLFIYMTMWHAKQYAVNHQPANHQI